LCQWDIHAIIAGKIWKDLTVCRGILKKRSFVISSAAKNLGEEEVSCCPLFF